ncbi:hypothetical protein D3C78_1510790 [compost metagenome]
MVASPNQLPMLKPASDRDLPSAPGDVHFTSPSTTPYQPSDLDPARNRYSPVASDTVRSSERTRLRSSLGRPLYQGTTLNILSTGHAAGLRLGTAVGLPWLAGGPRMVSPFNNRAKGGKGKR